MQTPIQISNNTVLMGPKYYFAIFSMCSSSDMCDYGCNDDSAPSSLPLHYHPCTSLLCTTFFLPFSPYDSQSQWEHLCLWGFPPPGLLWSMGQPKAKSCTVPRDWLPRDKWYLSGKRVFHCQSKTSPCWEIPVPCHSVLLLHHWTSTYTNHHSYVHDNFCYSIR